MVAISLAGCIVVEMLTGYPLFPGEDENDQLACIIEMFGLPDKKFLSTCKRQRYFITSRGLPRYCVQSVDHGVTELNGGYSKRGRYRGAPLTRDLVAALVSGGAIEAANDTLLVDLLRRCLEMNPDDRITASEAIRHDWLRRRQSRPPMKMTPGSTTRSTHGQFSMDAASSNVHKPKL